MNIFDRGRGSVCAGEQVVEDIVRAVPGRLADG
jgi:hypothetical protein